MIAAVLAALALSAGQQAAPAPAPAPAPATESPTLQTIIPAAAEQICRRQPIQGSRRSERVCHTKAEWEAIRDNARNNRDTASRDQRDRGGY
jgi:predicted transglutaminase-like cysteine proteinase